jgi:hypothetical protein
VVSQRRQGDAQDVGPLGRPLRSGHADDAGEGAGSHLLAQQLEKVGVCGTGAQTQYHIVADVGERVAGR